MSYLREKLVALWNERFLGAFQKDKREAKTLVSPEGVGLFDAVYSRALEDWYRSPQSVARYSKPRCFFCDRHDEHWYLELLHQCNHMGVFFNIKSVAPCHFLISPLNEHRETMAERDATALQDLARGASLAVFGNFRNSGASYPEHVHYQSLDVSFPITRRPVEPVVSLNSVTLSRLEYPVAAFRLSAVTNSGYDLIAKIVTRIPGAYNPLFTGENVFIVPRVKSVPSNTNGFKFAAAEVFGTVFSRSRDFYEGLTYSQMLTALREVCLPAGSGEAFSFEDMLRRTAEEVILG